MGQADRLALASTLVQEIKTALERSGNDRVKYGRVLLRKDVGALYSLIETWEREAR